MTTTGSMPTIGRRYAKGALLPSLAIDWYDGPASNASLVNLTGHTFSYTLAKVSAPLRAVVSSNATFTGAATSPNLVVDWSTGSLDALEPGDYELHIVATRNSDSKPRHCPINIRITIDPVAA